MKLSTLQNVALYIFFFSINFEAWDPFNTNGNFSISKLTGFFYFFSILPQIRYFLENKGFKRFLNPIWLFFCLLTLISFIKINYVSYSFFNFSLFQNILLFIFLINHARNSKGFFEKGLIAFALGSFALAILFILGIGVENNAGRVRLFGDNENVIGIRMCISIIFLFFFVLQNPLKIGSGRFLFLLPLPSMVSLLVATGSRVAFISFLLSFFIGVILIKTRKSYIKVFIVAISVITSIYLFNYILSSEVLYQRLMNSAENRNLSDRDIVWGSLIPLIKSSPIFGVGTTGYMLFTQQKLGVFISPHNVILEVLCYTGILGLSVYLIFLFRIFGVCISEYRYRGAVIQLLLLIPLIGLIFSGQILTSKIGWILFAFALGRSSLKGHLIQNREGRGFSTI